MRLSRRFALAVFTSLSGSVVIKGRAAEPMRIGVIGAGWLGGTVGRLWVQAGHEVLFSSRHPDELVSMTRSLGPRASVGTPRQAAEFGSTVLIAVPYSALPQLGRELQEVLRGEIVLDACNPGPSGEDALMREAQANGVGQTSAKYLPGTRLVRVFSAVDASAVSASARRQSGKFGRPRRRRRCRGHPGCRATGARCRMRTGGSGQSGRSRQLPAGRSGFPGEHDGTGTASPAQPARRELTTPRSRKD